jgi:DNA mismatch endonuclease (patch repair protein)
MADIVSKAVRSKMMAAIRGKNTHPEMLIRRALHRLGFRYRLHAKELPGKPDLLLPRYRSAIFVHGCFWHGHGCHLFKWPSTRKDFWRDKIKRNRVVDRRATRMLENDGWSVLVIWECALKGKRKRSLEEILTEVSQWIRKGKSVREIKGLVHACS